MHRWRRASPPRRAPARRPTARAPTPSTSSVIGATATVAHARRVASACAGRLARAGQPDHPVRAKLARHRERGACAERQEERQQQRDGQQVVERLVEGQRPAAHRRRQEPRAGEGHAHAEIGGQGHQGPPIAEALSTAKVKMARPGRVGSTEPATSVNRRSHWRRRRGSTASITRRAFHPAGTR